MEFLANVKRAVAVGTIALASACLVPSAQEEEPSVQGNFEDGDAEHRPGQPCLLCHGEGHFPIAPGESIFELAGTVYGDIDAPARAGLSDVEVIVTDASGAVYTGLSNRAGNFMFQLDSGLSAPVRNRKGKLRIGAELQYPLEVKIRQGDLEREMKSKIWRNGSCSHCHGETTGRTSVGRVYLFEEGLP
jgi:hypothetical protein